MHPDNSSSLLNFSVISMRLFVCKQKEKKTCNGPSYERPVCGEMNSRCILHKNVICMVGKIPESVTVDFSRLWRSFILRSINSRAKQYTETSSVTQ